MAKYYKTNPKIKFTDKNGARVADRMPTNVSKALPPEPILTIMNSLDILEKGYFEDQERQTRNILRIAGKSKPALTIPKIVSRVRGDFNDTLEPKIPKSVVIEDLPQYETHPHKRANIQNSLDILEKQIKEDPMSLPKIPLRRGDKAEIKLKPIQHTISEDTTGIMPGDTRAFEYLMSEQPHHKINTNIKNIQNSLNTSQEAIMQNSDIKNVFSVATSAAKKAGHEDFSEGSEGAKKRSEIAEAIKEKENIPVSKAVLLCKLDKQIIQLENKGISDDLVLKAYGSFDDVPDELRKQENRPPANWFTKALDVMQKSDYTGNAERYCIELWKSADGADDLIQKTLVKPLDGDEFFEREKLVEDAEEGGEAEEVIGDGTKVKTSDVKPMQTTSTN